MLGSRCGWSFLQTLTNHPSLHGEHVAWMQMPSGVGSSHGPGSTWKQQRRSEQAGGQARALTWPSFQLASGATTSHGYRSTWRQQMELGLLLACPPALSSSTEQRRKNEGGIRRPAPPCLCPLLRNIPKSSPKGKLKG